MPDFVPNVKAEQRPDTIVPVCSERLGPKARPRSLCRFKQQLHYGLETGKLLCSALRHLNCGCRSVGFKSACTRSAARCAVVARFRLRRGLQAELRELLIAAPFHPFVTNCRNERLLIQPRARCSWNGCARGTGAVLIISGVIH